MQATRELQPNFPLGPVSPQNGVVLIYDHGYQSESLQEICAILRANQFECSVIHKLERLEILKGRLLLTTAIDPESYNSLRQADFSEFFLIGVGEARLSEAFSLGVLAPTPDPFFTENDPFVSVEPAQSSPEEHETTTKPSWSYRPQLPGDWGLPTIEHIELPLEAEELLRKVSYWSRFSWQMKRRASFLACPFASQKNLILSGLGLARKTALGFEYHATETLDSWSKSQSSDFALTLNCCQAEFEGLPAHLSYENRALEDFPILPIAILSSSPQRLISWFEELKALPIKAVGICNPKLLRNFTRQLAPHIFLGDPDLKDDPSWAIRSDTMDFYYESERLWLTLTHREIEDPSQIKAFLEVAFDKANGQMEAFRCRKLLARTSNSLTNHIWEPFPYEALGWDESESSKLDLLINYLQPKIRLARYFHLKHQWESSFFAQVDNVHFGWCRSTSQLWAQDETSLLTVPNVTRCLLDYGNDYIGFMIRVSPNYHLPGLNTNFDFRFPHFIEKTPTGCYLPQQSASNQNSHTLGDQ